MFSRGRSKGKQTIQSKKTEVDGVKFASSLEAYMYKALKAAKIPNEYEGAEFILQEGFTLTAAAYERVGRREFKDNGGKKILPIKYTPDFVGDGFIIETKGRANESFPLRWKLFKALIAKTQPDTVLFKPQNQADCDETVEILLSMGKKKIKE
jgi:hypothetical protein